MPDALEVFKNGDHIGQFIRSDNRQITFKYDSTAPDTPISLSLPRHEVHTKRAAENFLSNLLPDNEGVRKRWARHLGTSDHAFDLLKHTGEDVAGALSLLPEGNHPELRTDAVRVATADDIADRIASLIDDRDAWIAPENIGKVRMSLAGAQGKFTLAKLDGTWFWSSAVLPSTHIFKPAFHDVESAPEFEAGALALARLARIKAPKASGIEVLGQHTYVVERFDRQVVDGRILRLHTEDFAQAAGRGPDQKYGIPAKQILNTLRVHATEEDRYSFVHMLIFNTAIGNSDAHGKNYSVYLEDGVHMAPLYDSIPTTVWPKYDEDQLAMKVGGASRSPEVSTTHWAKLAKQNDLDEDRVVDLARTTYATVAERGHDVFRAAGVREHLLDDWDRLVASTTRHLIPPASRGRLSAVAPTSRNSALRRGDVGLGKTAAGGTAGSFASHERSPGEPPTDLSRDLGLELDLDLDSFD